MKLTEETAKILRKLVHLNRTDGAPDTAENPTETRANRVLDLRKKLVEAMDRAEAKAARASESDG